MRNKWQTYPLQTPACLLVAISVACVRKSKGALELARLRCKGCMDHRDPAAVLMAARDVLETAGPGLSSSSRTGRDTPVQQSGLCVIRRAKDVSDGLLRPFRQQDEQVVLGTRTGNVEQPGTGERTRIVC